MSECLFCQIEQRKVPAEIVEEDRDVIAFKDVHPKAPTHLLIVPKEHITRLSDLTDASAKVMARVTVMANRLAERFGIARDRYRLVINCGPDAGQSVGHLHVHLLGGRVMGWPPG